MHHMNRLAILTYPDPRLRKKAAPISEITPELRELADDMLETMYAAPGIGLAATQVGVFQRIFVMDCATHDETPIRSRSSIRNHLEIGRTGHT